MQWQDLMCVFPFNPNTSTFFFAYEGWKEPNDDHKCLAETGKQDRYNLAKLKLGDSKDQLSKYNNIKWILYHVKGVVSSFVF